ncbi:O-Glycosyl hydrolases family 17 protein [Striga asiatica]|uniref:O-Glycosyl hydrolases family 17 protein n=1 Tax=Striga asiatica TaxID=4170 RepID=A0A5A7RED3_STRAF|nr:O-Glycosyl hydrolases family 17 protein [Striga asiatica]
MGTMLRKNLYALHSSRTLVLIILHAFGGEYTFTTVWLNQEMRPYLLRYPAIAISAANQVRVSQATDSERHSFHVTTPLIRRTDNPRMAAIRYNKTGTTIKDTSPGTTAALAQSTHPIGIFMVLNVKLAAKGLAAIAVKNIEDEITDVWKQVSISQEPSLFSVPSPTLLPQATQRDFTSGRKIPPALAETEGMAGARRASLKTRLPVLINPRAKKKASAISQGIGSPKAEKAAAKVRVLVRTHAPRPRRATAPSGSGWVMIPTMVARKMASSCQATRETPSGAGTNQRMTPVAIEAGAAAAEAEAAVVDRRFGEAPERSFCLRERKAAAFPPRGLSEFLRLLLARHRNLGVKWKDLGAAGGRRGFGEDSGRNRRLTEGARAKNAIVLMAVGGGKGAEFNCKRKSGIRRVQLGEELIEC